jgi:hypothetical protein
VLHLNYGKYFYGFGVVLLSIDSMQVVLTFTSPLSQAKRIIASCLAGRTKNRS